MSRPVGWRWLSLLLGDLFRGRTTTTWADRHYLTPGIIMFPMSPSDGYMPPTGEIEAGNNGVELGIGRRLNGMNGGYHGMSSNVGLRGGIVGT